jgi:CBS domain containing-hemolysin-like protein
MHKKAYATLNFYPCSFLKILCLFTLKNKEVIMKNLKLVTLENIDHIVTPADFEKVTLDSPAKKIFTDFKQFSPLVIEENTKAIDALKLMRKAHVHLKIVMSNNSNFVGVISSFDISEQQIMHKVATGYAREDILVNDLMLPRNDLLAFSIQELEHSTVNDVIEALKQNGLRHCLVIDSENHHIRGLISSSDIARKLHIPIEINTNVTFAKIFNAVNIEAIKT